MFCDLVGSTALSEKLTPKSCAACCTHIAPSAACHRPLRRVCRRYVGDGILTYFGWPTAHEKDAERANRAALEIVHAVKRASSTEDLSVRIDRHRPVVVGEQAGAV